MTKHSYNSLIFIAVAITSLPNLGIGQACDGTSVVLIEDGVCNNNPWVLAFEDDFNGNDLDFTKWHLPYQGVINDFEHETFKTWFANTGTTPSIPHGHNIVVSNGTLKLTVRKEVPAITGTFVTDWGTNPPTNVTEDFVHTAALIESNQKFHYGKYEIRCKIPPGKGFWPAFWMYGVGNNNVNNEIDVFEFFLNEDQSPDDLTNRHKMTAHYNGGRCGDNYVGPDYSLDFHVFSVEWDNYKMAWYVDGELKRISTKFYTPLGQIVDCNGINAFGSYIMDNVFPRDPMKILANISVQVGEDFEPNNNTPFPSSFEIDYIRYYKQMECIDDPVFVSLAQLNLDDELYNIIIGTTVTLDGSIELQAGQQLEIVARDAIIIGPGFHAAEGSSFIARIDPTICADVMKTDEVSGSHSGSDTLSYIVVSPDSDGPDDASAPSPVIRIFPNPSSGKVTVTFGHPVPDQRFEIHVFNAHGKEVQAISAVVGNEHRLDLSPLGAGLFVLAIVDKAKKSVHVNRIIIAK